MKLSRISSQIHFGGKIIDSHAHIGHWQEGANLRAFTVDQLDTFTKRPLNGADSDVVDKMIVSNLDCLSPAGNKDEYSANKILIDSIKGKSKYGALAACNPKSGSVENIKKIFNENPNSFIGLKFHPNGWQLEADSQLYDPYMMFAKEHNLPCVFHSDRSFDKTYSWKENNGLGVLVDKSSTVQASKYSRPDQIYTLAKRHPDVSVIMAHCGGAEKEDINAAVDVIISAAKNKDAKLYADMSWVSIDIKDNKRDMTNFINVIKRLKDSEAGDLTDRILFGTDAPLGIYSADGAKEIYSRYVTDIKNAIKKSFGQEADNLIDKIFYKNAEKLFFNNACRQVQNITSNSAISQETKSSVRKISKTKLGIIIGIGVAVAAGGAYLLFNKKTQQRINSKA